MILCQNHFQSAMRFASNDFVSKSFSKRNALCTRSVVVTTVGAVITPLDRIGSMRPRESGANDVFLIFLPPLKTLNVSA